MKLITSIQFQHIGINEGECQDNSLDSIGQEFVKKFLVLKLIF